MITLCHACGTSYDGAGEPAHCKICADERQYIPATGQKWVGFDTVKATHTNKWQQLEPELLSIKTVPAFAINQRALLLRTPQGNILWDCIANLDPATRSLVSALGGSTPLRYRIRTIIQRCRTGPRPLTPRCIFMPAIANG